ncbi:LysR family transcriptional regulator [Vibrio profundum]|uniref:LysR family transcriptional regulator n=1 Tax=Vibrio profundum TaxID=2910247 RepID=UPI003D0B2400
MLNLKQLETFVWIAKLGSFRQAAEHLCATQPAISARINNLEQSLNANLFHRETSRISLTAKGRELLPLAEHILDSSNQLCSQANVASTLSGLLRIGVSETLVHTWLPQLLAKIHQTFPDVDVELVVDASVVLNKELLNRSIDIAILLGPVNAPEASNLPICQYPLQWVASPTLALTKLDSVQSFLRWPIITYARNTAPFHEIQRHLKEQKAHPIRFYSTSSLSASIKLAESGVGIATLPKEVIGEQIDNGKLIVIDAKWHPSPLAFSLSSIPGPNDALIKAVSQLALDTASNPLPVESDA